MQLVLFSFYLLLHLLFDGLCLLDLADGAVVLGPLRAVVGLASLRVDLQGVNSIGLLPHSFN